MYRGCVWRDRAPSLAKIFAKPPLVYDSAEPLKRRARRVRALFDALDVEGTGYVDYGDLRAHVKALAPGVPDAAADGVSRHWLEHVDVNHDQKVTWEEFWGHVEAKERELWDLFQRLDADGDGFIRRDDLAASFREAGIVLDRKGLDEFIRDVDRDGNGLIDFPELRDFVIPLWRTRLADIVAYYRDVYDPNLHVEFVGPDALPHRRLRSFLAGAVAGAVSRSAVAPLERIQCLMNTQTHRELRFARDFRDAFRAIWRADGPRGFWRGNLVNALRIAPSMSITFGVFEECKRALARLEGVSARDLGPRDRFVAGAVAGLTSMVATYPFEVVQVRLMATINVREVVRGAAEGAAAGAAAAAASGARHLSTLGAARQALAAQAADGHPPASSSAPRPSARLRRPLSTSLLLRTVREMYAEGGMRRFYRGLAPSALGIVPYAGLNLMTFETLKQRYTRRINSGLRPSDPRRSPGPVALLGMGVAATAAAAAATYPLSAVRQRMQAQGTASHPARYKGMLDVFARTARNEGVWGFYRGLPASLAKALPSASISYVIYETMKEVLGVPKE